MYRIIFSFFAACALAATASAGSFVQSARSVDRFDFVEITLTLDEPAAGTPFIDAAFSGEFLPAGATALEVDGFCDRDDGRVFRLRFMPALAGKHTYALTFRNGARELKHTGEFTARTGKRPGPVRVDQEHPTHFVHDGTGGHFFYNSTTAYWLLGFQDDAVIRESIDRLARLEVNRIRVALS
ncbi:MAG: DUF5060 domain-containing protein, partial [Opitutaceae bacterium]